MDKMINTLRNYADKSSDAINKMFESFERRVDLVHNEV